MLGNGRWDLTRRFFHRVLLVFVRHCSDAVYCMVKLNGIIKYRQLLDRLIGVVM